MAEEVVEEEVPPIRIRPWPEVVGAGAPEAQKTRASVEEEEVGPPKRTLAWMAVAMPSCLSQTLPVAVAVAVGMGDCQTQPLGVGVAQAEVVEYLNTVVH